MQNFGHIANILVVALVFSLLASFAIVRSQSWHGKHTHDHDLEGVQKFHHRAVPRIGGLALVLGILLTVTLGSLFASRMFHLAYWADVLLLMAASLPVLGAGVLEDLTKRVSVKVRLISAFSSALLASTLMGATLTHLNIWGVDSLMAITSIGLVVTSLTVAGGVNAINIVDGFNGLAASVALVICAAFGVLAYGMNDGLVTVLAALGCGATMGFLLVNYPSGRLFLGDGGAYFLGFWISEMAVLLLVRHREVNAWQILSICAYPVTEVLYSIYRRKFVRGGSAGEADALHLHTLIYRRYICNVLRHNARAPWVRNASVAMLVMPCMTTFVAFTLLIGQTINSALLLVAIQTLLYLAVYARLVRGRWRRAVSLREAT